MTNVVTMTLTGRLDRAQLDKALTNAESAIASRLTVLVVDCSEMRAYDSDARERFVEWNRAWADRLEHVLVVTRNPLWHMVIRAMALASGRRMQAFSTLQDANAWLRRSPA